jgi:hypothetical protein
VLNCKPKFSASKSVSYHQSHQSSLMAVNCHWIKAELIYLLDKRHSKPVMYFSDKFEAFMLKSLN